MVTDNKANLRGQIFAAPAYGECPSPPGCAQRQATNIRRHPANVLLRIGLFRPRLKVRYF